MIYLLCGFLKFEDQCDSFVNFGSFFRAYTANALNKKATQKGVALIMLIGFCNLP